MTAFLIALVRAYRAVLAPFFGPCCRFEPSCSVYAEEALSRHGSLRGSRLAIARICRCQPLGRAGFDPVPDQVGVYMSSGASGGVRGKMSPSKVTPCKVTP